MPVLRSWPVCVSGISPRYWTAHVCLASKVVSACYVCKAVSMLGTGRCIIYLSVLQTITNFYPVSQVLDYCSNVALLCLQVTKCRYVTVRYICNVVL